MVAYSKKSVNRIYFGRIILFLVDFAWLSENKTGTTSFAYGTSAAVPSVLRQQDGRLSAVLLFHNFRLFPK